MRQAWILLAFLAVGCDDKSSGQATPAATATSPATTSAAAMTTMAATAPPVTVAPSGKMAHCPNVVAGATTAINDVEGGVEISVTAKDPAATSDIRARTKALADAMKAAAPQKHNGKGGGHGELGRCPVIVRDTTLDVADVEGGSKITVKPKDAAQLDWLKRETRQRDAKLHAPNADGAGSGRMAHCPVTVDGAATTVSDTKEGVKLVVTGKGDATQQIRDRAKTLADVAKHAPGDVKHTGDGKGGGALGRCPVVVKDTVVEAKDVPDGSQILVKAKNASDVAALQKSSKDRLASLTRK